MGTNKPQFSCYLDPQVNAEIEAHLAKSGQSKGKFIEQLWRFYNFRDLSLLYDRLASSFTGAIDPNKKIRLARVSDLLRQLLKGEAE